MVITASGTGRQCLIVAAVLLFGCGALPAWARSCPPAKQAPTFRLRVDLPRPTYRHTLTRPQIGALGGKGYMSNDRRHAGLTRARTDFHVRPQVRVRQMGDGTVCVQLDAVEAVWQMTQLQVDIAAEYGRSTCAYREILRHENQHVTISQTYFKAAERALRTELSDLAQSMGAIRMRGSSQAAAQAIAERFMDRAQPILDAYKSATGRDNAAIDTPESYRSVGARCTDW